MSEKLSDCTTFDSNPFLKEIRDYNIIQSKDTKVIIPTNLTVKGPNGNHISHAFIKQNHRKFSDIREFARIPIDGLKIISSLEKTELKILCYILEFLIYGILEIEIKAEIVKAHYGYVSRNPVYTGIVGLIKKDLIAKKKDSKAIFFINPLFFYKGTIIKPFFEHLANNEEKMIDNTTEGIEENKYFYTQKEIVN